MKNSEKITETTKEECYFAIAIPQDLGDRLRICKLQKDELEPLNSEEVLILERTKYEQFVASQIQELRYMVFMANPDISIYLALHQDGKPIIETDSIDINHQIKDYVSQDSQDFKDSLLSQKIQGDEEEE